MIIIRPTCYWFFLQNMFYDNTLCLGGGFPLMVTYFFQSKYELINKRTILLFKMSFGNNIYFK